MVNDSKNNDSVYSKKSNDLLSGMKRYLRIEHKDDDKELMEYLRKQAGLHREQRSDSAFDIKLQVSISINLDTILTAS